MAEMIVIRDMGPDEYGAKGRVHYLSWQESYRGIVAEEYLSGMSEEKCREMASRFPKNTAVALVDDEVIGFVAWGQNQDEDHPGETGEIYALYVLEVYKGRGIGKKLLEYGLEKLACYRRVCLWVLAENRKAIGFYEHLGFAADGEERMLTLGTPVRCIRMCKRV